MSLAPYLLILVGATIRDDVACIGAGIAVARGDVAWLPALVACFVGTLGMDVFFFCCGRYGGHWALRLPPIHWLVPERRLTQAITVLARYGSLVILVSRFLPALRTPLQFAAGLAHAKPTRALVYLVLACAIYVPLVFAGGFWFGEAVLQPLGQFQSYGLPILIAAGLAILLAVIVIRRRLGRLSLAADKQ